MEIESRSKKDSTNYPILNYPITKSDLVGLVRIELTTSPLSGVRSSQLSYRPSLRDIPINLIRVSGQRAPTSASLDARAKQHHREALI